MALGAARRELGLLLGGATRANIGTCWGGPKCTWTDARSGTRRGGGNSSRRLWASARAGTGVYETEALGAVLGGLTVSAG
jgi:hypothetical protein